MESTKRKTTEWCKNCGFGIELQYEYTVHTCPKCGNRILPCNLCYSVSVDCNECHYNNNTI